MRPCETYYSMVFRVFTKLCKHHHNLKSLHHPNKTPYAFYQSLPTFCEQPHLIHRQPRIYFCLYGFVCFEHSILKNSHDMWSYMLAAFHLA